MNARKVHGNSCHVFLKRLGTLHKLATMWLRSNLGQAPCIVLTELLGGYCNELPSVLKTVVQLAIVPFELCMRCKPINRVLHNVQLVVSLHL